MTNKDRIYNDMNDIVVSAGAGSGKTSLLVNKLRFETKNNRTHYKTAAVTFTNKAANELKERSGEFAQNNFFGTNDSFVETEIIRPFIKDVYGENFISDFECEYYNSKFNSYEEGLNLLETEGILGTYYNKKKNFKFELARDVLINSSASRRYLMAKYQRIFIDEYQDCDKDMHGFFMHLKYKLNIKLFIVGDPKQSIYIWRGADPCNFNNLLQDNGDFSVYELTQNYRCCKDIQNYSNAFFLNTQHRCNFNGAASDVIGLKNDYTIQELYDESIIDINKELVILTWKRDVAKSISNQLNNEGFEFTYIPRTPLDSSTKNSHLLIELSKYVKNKMYSVFDLVNNLGVELASKEIKELSNEIEILRSDLLNKEKINTVLDFLAEMLQLQFNDDEIGSFSSVILTNEYDIAFNGEERMNKVMTFHSSKGLEFEQVYLLASDFQLNRGKGFNEHYVATTRGKNKLIINLNNNYYYNYLQRLKKDLSLNSLGDLIKVI